LGEEAGIVESSDFVSKTRVDPPQPADRARPSASLSASWRNHAISPFAQFSPQNQNSFFEVGEKKNNPGHSSAQRLALYQLERDPRAAFRNTGSAFRKTNIKRLPEPCEKKKSTSHLLVVCRMKCTS